MVKKTVTKEIDRVIKEIWMKNIPKDFNEDYLINEDSLKMALCYHMRRKLSALLKENNLRIYTEKYFPENVAALIELKFKGDMSQSTANWIKEDLKKLKEYANYSGLSCPLYFGVIYEVDCEWLHWFDKRITTNWAAGRVTELDAGWIGDKFLFEVNQY